MGDVLSQEEIDSLLNALSSGNEEEIKLASTEEVKEAVKYDFARPSKFNKEQLRTLEIIFDNYSRALTSFLTGYLRTNVEIEVINSEQITYKDFTNSLSNPTILSIVDFDPFKGSIILELSNNIGYAIIDRILGGPGYPINDTRDLSEIEKVLLERVFVQMLNYMPDSWENVSKVDPKLDQIETNVQFAQVLPPNEMTALITLDVKIGSVKGFFNFCIPHIVIEPITQKLNTTNWFGSKKNLEGTSIFKEQLEDRLENTRIDVSAVIGRTTIMVNDFVNLQEGDIIPLDSYINSNLNVMVGNLLKFNAKPGISRGKNAIQITSLITREE